MERKDALLTMLGLDSDPSSKSNEQLLDDILKIDEAKKVLDDYYKKAKDILFKVAEEEGEADDKGSLTVTLPNGMWFKKEARVSMSIDEDKVKELNEQKSLSFVSRVPEINRNYIHEAVELLEKQLPEAIEDFIFEVDEEGLEQAYANGEITDDELKSIIDRKVSYALKKCKREE